MPKFLDITGQRFGRLIAKSFDGRDAHRHALWVCECDCGKACTTTLQQLRKGDTRSCGCLWNEVRRRNGALFDGSSNITHGLSKCPEYFIWKTMRQRAKGRGPAKDREVYRGVTCCPEWEDFAQFYADMGPRPSPQHSIDRINPWGNYEPANCRWATATEQARNTRKATERGLARSCHAPGLADATSETQNGRS